MTYPPRWKQRSGLFGSGRAIRSTKGRAGAHFRTGPDIAESTITRLWNRVPGLFAWFCLLGIVYGSLVAPWITFTIAAIIAIYMGLRLALAALSNIVGYRRIRAWNCTDWRAEYARRKQPNSLSWESVVHLVVLPSFREDVHVLRQTLARVAESSVAHRQVVVVLAMEATDPDGAEIAATLITEFRNQFRHIIVTVHPRGLPGEIPGKSSNELWAVRHAKHELVDEMGIPLDHVVVTSMDADSLLHPRYLDSLTCLFATAPDRDSRFWQAPPYYHNNVWENNPLFGLMHAYSSAWELAYLTAWWWQAIPFSTYSLSLRLVEDVGYWDPDVIADESHMFIKCYLARGGKAAIEAIYLPFTCYPAGGASFLEVCRNRYRQTVRHAWGAAEIGYMLGLIINRPAPLLRTTRVLLRVTHDHLMAGAGWIVISLGTQLPILLHPQLLTEALRAPQFILLQIALGAGTLFSIMFWVLDVRLRPARPHPWKMSELVLTAASFAALPGLVLCLLAIPVIEAHTRLMLGAQLRFRVTRKV